MDVLYRINCVMHLRSFIKAVTDIATMRNLVAVSDILLKFCRSGNSAQKCYEDGFHEIELCGSCQLRHVQGSRIFFF